MRKLVSFVTDQEYMKTSKLPGLIFCVLLACLFAPRAHATLTLTTLGAFGSTNGANPYSPPTLLPDGTLYGVTPYGGATNIGVIYKIGTNNQMVIVHSFHGNDGRYPLGPLLFASDGNLYGTTDTGGTNNQGTIFRLTTNGTFTSLYSFGTTNTDGANVFGGLTQGKDGNFYGTTLAGGASSAGTVYRFSTNGTVTTLYSFTGVNHDGASPYIMQLVEGEAGVFYGTTSLGGANGLGTVFQVATNGVLNTLHEFDGTDGSTPYAGLSLGSDGFFYGSTVSGGTSNFGVVFRIGTNGDYSPIFQFLTPSFPEGGVVAGINNNLYGSIYRGGSAGYGAIFRLTTNGFLSALYSFANGADGANPFAGVTLGSGGTLYGATLTSGRGGQGTVFRLNDASRPTLTITTPVANASVSNGNFTVIGITTDNGAVANVYYSFNNSPWLGASTTNSYMNWTALVNPVVGTNTISAYAMDDAGHFSATNTVKFTYVLSGVLDLGISGKGTLSPNFSNTFLQIGITYSMKATPASGFNFINWTDGLGNVVTNGATLRFVMASNLTFRANFIDVTRPTVSITTPTANALVSNAVYTIVGTATDNGTLTNVFYSLNNAPWASATMGNNWSNWTAQVNLAAGTNMISAYSADSAGNLSTTSTVKFVYIVSGVLNLGTTGKGTLAPNYSNTFLQIGIPYSMKATAATGFTFVNWTDGIGNVLTNGATLKFIMASNLTFRANFADTTPPMLTIVAPTSGQHISNALATVIGTASDNVKVAGVWYQLNGGLWNQPASSNGWTNWTAKAELTAGTNIIKAYAQDLMGNLSSTSSVSFISSNTFMLKLGFPSPQPLASNGLNYALQVSLGLNGHIQVSTNLTNWTVLTNFVGTNNTLHFRDAAATNLNLRFYRAVIP